MVRPLAWLRYKRVWIPLALVVAYGLFGFFVAPPILRTQIVAGIRKTYGREVSLARVRFNPFIFALTLEGFELRDPDGTPFVGFDRLYVDFQLSSLPRMALTFRELSLTRPRVHIRLMPKGEANFADLIPKDNGKPPRLIIGRLAIAQGSLEMTNLMASEPETGKFEPLDLDLRNFTNIPDQRGQYHIAATGPGGGAWEWTGSLVSEPLHASGVFEIRNSQLRRFWEIAKHRVPFEITDGRLSCRVGYDVKAKGDSVQARLINTMVSVAGLGVRQKGHDPELLHLDTLRVSGIDLRYPEQTAAISQVLLAGTRIHAWLNPDRTLNWLAMLPLATPNAAPAKAGATKGAAAKPAGTKPVPASQAASSANAVPWDVTLSEFAVRDLGVAFEDRSVRPVFAISVQPVNVTVRNISSRPGAAFDVASDVTIAEKGRFACSGKVTAIPTTTADLKLGLTSMPLAIFQTYVNPVAKVRIIGGSVGASGNLTFRDRKPAPDVHFTGRAESRGLLIRDRIDNERFLTWKGVDVEKIDATASRLRVGSILFTQPYAKFIIHRDRTTNVQEILGLQSPPQDTTQIAALDDEESAAGPDVEGALSSAEPTPSLAAPAPRDTTVHVTLGAPATPAASAAGSAPAFPVTIAEVRIRDGSADFADLSLVLPFAARIEDLKGKITGISSDSASRASVEADGALEPSGTAQVRGEMNPLAKEPALDLAVVFHGFNMPGLTPYTGQYLGREVDKGEMSLDLQYKLEGKHLVGENKIVMDQFELGKKVESPEATKLPVGLALAILKDREGKIDLDVPVEGNVDDPKFRIGRVIMQFLLRLLTKVAMSPFALLGHMFGGGHADQLDHVDFALGTSDLASDQQETLGKLAKALDQRPQLKLEVRGRSDADSDAVAIRKSKFATLAAEKIESNPKKYGGLGYSLALLEDLYIDRFGKKGLREFRDKHQVAAGSLPPSHPQYKAGSKKMVVDEAAWAAAIQSTLIALQTADATELLALANARGSAIKQSLVAQGVDEGRVYVTEPQPGKAADGRVRVDLTLTD